MYKPASADKILFKRCALCGAQWHSREQFLSDPGIELVGYQVNFSMLKLGLLLFNHACKTTLAVYAKHFENLYDGPVFASRATGSEDCPGYCLHRCELRPCPTRCECAYIREILSVIKAWPKQGA